MYKIIDHAIYIGFWHQGSSENTVKRRMQKIKRKGYNWQTKYRS